MNGLDKALVDTSVWIEYFKKREPYYFTIGNWIDEDRICCVGLVLAELLQGSKTEKELGVLKDFLYVFKFLEESKKLWERAGELSFNLNKKGHRVGLSDCYIAAVACANNAGIITLDKHFGLIKEVIDIRLIEL